MKKLTEMLCGVVLPCSCKEMKPLKMISRECACLSGSIHPVNGTVTFKEKKMEALLL